MAVFAVLALAGPLLLLATTVVGLWSYGPLGWLASVLLVSAVAGACRWTARTALRWWRSTRAPEQPQWRPSDARRDAGRQPTAAAVTRSPAARGAGTPEPRGR